MAHEVAPCPKAFRLALNIDTSTTVDQIITGDLSKHRVRQVIVTQPDVDTGPGWKLYASIRDHGANIHHGDGSRHTIHGTLTVMDADGHLVQLANADVWRAGSGPPVPDGALVVKQSDSYPVTREELVRPRRPMGYFPAPEGPMTEDEVRRERRDINVIFHHLWTSPRILTIADEARVAPDVLPPTELTRCSVRPENGCWTYATGTGGHLKVWGAAATQAEAILLATARMHAAWIDWHDRVLALAGGRTDWLGGLPAPQPCEVLLLGRGEAEQLVGDIRAYDQVNEAMRGGTQAALREIIDACGFTRAQLAEVLDVSIMTVDSWLRPPDNKAYRPMPVRELQNLRLRLAAGTSTANPRS